MHIRMQVRGSYKKRPQLAAACCMWSTRTTGHGHVEFACPSGYEESDGTWREVPSCAPPPLPSTYPALPNGRPKKKAQRLMRREILVFNPVLLAWWCAADGGMERTAGPADHSRSRRPIIMRGTRRVGARVVASGGGLYCQFCISFLPFHFPLLGLIKERRPNSDSCILHLMTTAACSICKTACLCACSLGANLSLSLRPPNPHENAIIVLGPAAWGRMMTSRYQKADPRPTRTHVTVV